MPVFAPSAARPRQELAMAIVEGEQRAENLIGPMILPDFPVNKRTAHIIKATLADTQAMRILTDKYLRAPGTKFERLIAKFGDDTFTMAIRGAEIVVPNEVELDYDDYLDVEVFFAGRFGETAVLTKEYMIAAAIFNTTNFGAATNSGVAYTAANLVTISLISDIIAASRRVKARGQVPDTVAMSGTVFERVRQAATVAGYVAGTLRAGQEATRNMIEQALAEFGIKNLLVGDSYINTAADGATPSLTAVWSNTYIWVGQAGKVGGADTEGMGVPSLGGVGANIFWEDYTPENGYFVESYPDMSVDSMIERVKMSSTPYIGNARGGELIATQYS